MKVPAVVLVAALACTSALAQSSQFFVTNLTDGATRRGGHWIILQQEKAQDLNGDGDKSDKVLVTYDSTTHAFTSLGLALTQSNSSLVATADELICAVDEASQGNVDLNGDGDKLDQVMAVYHFATHTTVNLGIAMTRPYQSIAPDGSCAAFYRSESKAGLDLDGDGDAIDMVVFAIDPKSNAVFNTGKSIAFANSALGDSMPTLALNGGKIVLGVYEPSQSVDHTGDGDLLDIEFSVFDVATATSLDTGLAIRDLDADQAASKAFLMLSENDQKHTDLDGDGDALDGVGEWFDAATGALHPLGLAGTWITSNATGVVDVASGRACFGISEAGQGHTDYNGDGDASDLALMRVDLATGAIADVHASCSYYGRSNGDAVAYVNSESSEHLDFNGDGDMIDLVCVYLNLATGAVVPTSIESIGTFDFDVHHVLGTMKEQPFGATSLNFDGDAADEVAVWFDADRHETAYLPSSATAGWQYLVFDSTSPALAGWHAFETENDRDLNGDGDKTDTVAYFHDRVDGTSYSSGYAVSSFFAADDEALLYVNEAQQNADLNGDGVKNSTLDVFFKRVPLVCGRIENFGSGCPTSTGPAPRLQVDGCMVPGGAFSLQVRGGPTGQFALIAFGTQAQPAGAGCSLQIASPFPALLWPLPLVANGKLKGAWQIETKVPGNAIPGTVALQAFAANPGLANGFAATQGTLVTIAP